MAVPRRPGASASLYEQAEIQAHCTIEVCRLTRLKTVTLISNQVVYTRILTALSPLLNCVKRVLYCCSRENYLKYKPARRSLYSGDERSVRGNIATIRSSYSNEYEIYYQ